MRTVFHLGLLVLFASTEYCNEQPPNDDLKKAVQNYYRKQFALPLAYLKAPANKTEWFQLVLRFEVKNSYKRNIDGEQFHFYDIAVEIYSKQLPSADHLLTELLPLKFVKRGDWWYSSRNVETEIQELPNGSLSKDAITCADIPIRTTHPTATPAYDWDNRPGNARSMGATQQMVDEANKPDRRPPPGRIPSKDEKLVRFANRAKTCSVLVPTDVFANGPSQPNDEDMTFVADDKTQLSVTVRPVDPDVSLNDVFKDVLASRASSASTTRNHVVDYKVVNKDWFVVSGSDNGRGYYVKCIRKEEALFFMDLEYDEHACPISKESFTRMSQGFRVDAAKED